MKKRLFLVFALVFAAVLALGVFLAVRFFGLYADAQSTQSDALSVDAYAQQSLSAYRPQYDDAASVLTLTKATDLTYDEACRYGASIYEGDLAPETYLTQVRTIALDVASKCGVTDLSVVLRYVSTDNKVIFSVAADGTVTTCWDVD